ncbi:MAG TPA: DUF805 domain-containing protein [Sphingomicrobium sp.]|nr:DUF805 domain-containing protein [Sphingomicrobium sp.]
MFEAMMQPLRKYADFKGRASREEFWFFMLFCAVAMAVSGVVLGRLAGLVGILLICPQIAVAVRRLHDVGRSGKDLIVPYVMLALAPIVALFGALAMKALALGYAGLVLLLFANLLLSLIKKGSSIPNRYGASPKAFSFAK